MNLAIFNVISIIINCMGLTCSSVITHVIYRDKCKTSVDIFSMSFCIGCIIWSLTFIAINTFSLVEKHFEICRILSMLCVISIVSQLINFSMISLCRYIRVAHIKTMKLRKVYLTFVFVWLFSIFGTVFFDYFTESRTGKVTSGAYCFYNFLSPIIVFWVDMILASSIVLGCFLYYRIYKFTHNVIIEIRKSENKTIPRNFGGISPKTKLKNKFVSRSMVLVAVFLISWLTIAITSIATVLGGKSPVYAILVWFFGSLNSIIFPVMCGTQDDRIKRWLSHFRCLNRFFPKYEIVVRGDKITVVTVARARDDTPEAIPQSNVTDEMRHSAAMDNLARLTVNGGGLDVSKSPTNKGLRSPVHSPLPTPLHSINQPPSNQPTVSLIKSLPKIRTESVTTNEGNPMKIRISEVKSIDDNKSSENIPIVTPVSRNLLPVDTRRHSLSSNNSNFNSISSLSPPSSKRGSRDKDNLTNVICNMGRTPPLTTPRSLNSPKNLFSRTEPLDTPNDKRPIIKRTVSTPRIKKKLLAGSPIINPDRLFTGSVMTVVNASVTPTNSPEISPRFQKYNIPPEFKHVSSLPLPEKKDFVPMLETIHSRNNSNSVYPEKMFTKATSISVIPSPEYSPRSILIPDEVRFAHEAKASPSGQLRSLSACLEELVPRVAKATTSLT